jgi:hypothetical protein
MFSPSIYFQVVVALLSYALHITLHLPLDVYSGTTKLSWPSLVAIPMVLAGTV